LEYKVLARAKAVSMINQAPTFVRDLDFGWNIISEQRRREFITASHETKFRINVIHLLVYFRDPGLCLPRSADKKYPVPFKVDFPDECLILRKFVWEKVNLPVFGLK
jgi:hypothetical protein